MTIHGPEADIGLTPQVVLLLAILGSVFGALRGGAMGRRMASKPPGASED